MPASHLSHGRSSGREASLKAVAVSIERQKLGRLLPVGFQPRSHENRLSNSISMSLAGDMRRPDRTELEFAVLLFAGLVPTAHYTVRFVMGLI